MSEQRLVGIAGWRLVPNEPRHNTFHNSLHSQAVQDDVQLEYFGLRNTHPTNWIKQELPDSILKKHPYLSLTEFYRFRSKANLAKNQNIVLYIFEGSISWLIMLSLYAYLNPRLTIVCNLFSSSKYNRILFSNNGRLKRRYGIFFSIFSKLKQSVITFDTSTMANKTKAHVSASNIGTFPVTSSFPYQPISRVVKDHFNVLVNMRSFSLEDLHVMLRNSCPQCTFTFPRGPMAQPSLEAEFSVYPNARFDQQSIPVDGYMDYFDSFDYIILMYEPSIDASGKLLDAIARGIPVCIPSESLEWVSISKNWGKHFIFNWMDISSMAKSFDHPAFTQPVLKGEPSFTPTKTLEAIQAFHVFRPKMAKITILFRSLIVFGYVFFYSNLARILNFWAGLLYVLRRRFKVTRGQ